MHKMTEGKIWDDMNAQDEPHRFAASGTPHTCNRCGKACKWNHIPGKGWVLYEGFKKHECR